MQISLSSLVQESCLIVSLIILGWNITKLLIVCRVYRWALLVLNLHLYLIPLQVVNLIVHTSIVYPYSCSHIIRHRSFGSIGCLVNRLFVLLLMSTSYFRHDYLRRYNPCSFSALHATFSSCFSEELNPINDMLSLCIFRFLSNSQIIGGGMIGMTSAVLIEI